MRCPCLLDLRSRGLLLAGYEHNYKSDIIIIHREIINKTLKITGILFAIAKLDSKLLN